MLFKWWKWIWSPFCAFCSYKAAAFIKFFSYKISQPISEFSNRTSEEFHILILKTKKKVICGRRCEVIKVSNPGHNCRQITYWNLDFDFSSNFGIVLLFNAFFRMFFRGTFYPWMLGKEVIKVLNFEAVFCFLRWLLCGNSWVTMEKFDIVIGIHLKKKKNLKS